jgi:diguanylate cyclase (GGDEF)-like protein
MPAAAKWSGWLAGYIAFLVADLVTGSSLLRAVLLNSANIVSVAAAYFLVLSRLPDEIIKLKQPISIIYIVLAATVGGIAAGFVGIYANWILFNGKPLPAFTLWWASEIVNYVSILPILLSAPNWKDPVEWVSKNGNIKIKQLLPAMAVILSCVLSYIIGGPGAIAFPTLALLWCALVYKVFSTSILTLICSAFALLFISTINDYTSGIDRQELVSIRLGAAVVAITPIIISIVINNRNQLLEELRYLSSHDSLTGVLNRGGFYKEAQKALENNQTSHAFIMIDIDHFKTINDSYGHSVGDAVLKKIAGVIKECVRPNDKVCRMGGEEFAVCLNDSELIIARAVAERIRGEISNTVLTTKSEKTFKITASLGLSFRQKESNKKLDTLLNEADTALYQSKKKGRDRVENSI